MLADEDNPLESPEIPVANPADGPQLVVVYRSRGVPWLLIPPLLLLAAVGGVVGYRKSARPEVKVVTLVSPAPPSLTLPGPERPTSQDVPAVSSEPVTKPAGESTLPVGTGAIALTSPPSLIPESALPSPPLPGPTPPAAIPAAPNNPDAEGMPVPEAVPARREPVGFDPDAARTIGGADAPRRPATEEIRADMRREADERLAEQLRLEAMKPDLLNPDPREVRKRRDELILSARRQAAQERIPFHAELRQILLEPGNLSGREIQRLCDRYVLDIPPEIFEPMNRDLVGPATRLTTQGRVARMRRWGAPETVILHDLVEQSMKDRNTRGGPRNPTEAWVFAARMLLAMPPSPVASATAPPVKPPAVVPVGR